MPMMPPRRCPTCGDVFAESRCPRCARRRRPVERRFAKVIDYAGKRWRTLRAQVLSEEPFCPCGDVATVVDHRQRHEGHVELMFERSNLQPLCKSCHDAKTWTETLAGDTGITSAERPTSRGLGRFSRSQVRGTRG